MSTNPTTNQIANKTAILGTTLSDVLTELNSNISGQATTAIANHVAENDPHTQYLKETDAAISYAPLSHTTNLSNPHSVTKAQVGLGSVDNTSDLAKPISTATQTALNGKADTAHTHTALNITDFSEAVDDRVASLLVAGTNITLTYSDVANTLTVDATGGAGGEANTASNLGAGNGVFAQKDGVDLQFKSLVAGSNVTLTPDANTITIASTGGGSSFTTTTTATSKTLANFERCFVTAATQTITLPATPSAGWEVAIGVNAFTDTVIARNGSNIMSLAENMTINSPNIVVSLVYVDASQGWRIL